MRNTGNKSLLVIIAVLTGVIAALCAAFLTWRDGKSPYKASISGFAAFAATVLLAIAVEQALGMLD
jgi:VIT1/CCC1 family predicted Fe2+/Mn2+ transporter